MLSSLDTGLSTAGGEEGSKQRKKRLADAHKDARSRGKCVEKEGKAERQAGFTPSGSTLKQLHDTVA